MIAFVQRYLVAGLLVVVALLAAALAWQTVRVSNAREETASTVAAWNADKAQASAAAAVQSETFRAKESAWNMEREKNVEAARNQLAAHADALRAGTAERDRLRSTVATYVARARGAAAAPGAPAGGPAAGDALDLLANLYARSDEAAGIFADAADRARIAGLACERAYDSTVN